MEIWLAYVFTCSQCFVPCIGSFVCGGDHACLLPPNNVVLIIVASGLMYGVYMW